jgi:hypothetical protein
MNESALSPSARQDIRQEALRQARAEVEQEVRREIVDIFRELLQQLWERVAALLGEAATAAIFGAAKREACRGHPFLEGVEVTAAGIDVERLQRPGGPRPDGGPDGVSGLRR